MIRCKLHFLIELFNLKFEETIYTVHSAFCFVRLHERPSSSSSSNRHHYYQKLFFLLQLSCLLPTYIDTTKLANTTVRPFLATHIIIVSHHHHQTCKSTVSNIYVTWWAVYILFIPVFSSLKLASNIIIIIFIINPFRRYSRSFLQLFIVFDATSLHIFLLLISNQNAFL